MAQEDENEAKLMLELEKNEMYEPFPSFSEWAALAPPEKDLDNAWRDLAKERAICSEVDNDKVAILLGREAAAETGAIEELYDLAPGDSLTIAAEKPGWEALLADSRIRSDFDSQLNAYEFVRDMVPTEFGVTESFIRELHKRACASQTHYTVLTPNSGGGLDRKEIPLILGEFKRYPNHVITRSGRTFFYAPVFLTESEMGRLVEELNSESFLAAHPIVQAAYAHYGFVRIHPFPDGNGRVARVLASYYCYRYSGLPLIVYSDRKLTYRQALQRADRRQYQSLVDYMSDLTLDTIGRAVQEFRALRNPQLAVLTNDIQSLALQASGITVENASMVAQRLQEALLEKVLEKTLPLGEAAPDVVNVGVENFHVPASGLPRQYTPVLPSIIINASSLKGATISVEERVGVGYAQDLSSRFAFCVSAGYDSHYDFERFEGSTIFIRFDDVYPKIGTSVHGRLDLFVETTLRHLLETLRLEMRKMLRQVGYDSTDS